MQIQATELKQQDPSIVSQIDLSFLPFAAQNYSISPNIDDYLIFTTLICPSDLPNRNGIAFPLSELIRFTPTPSPHMVYKGWNGCPVHLEHCFPGDVRVRTDRGLKRIDRVKVGDLVLTHNVEYKRVTKVFKNGRKPLISIDALGLLRPLRLTENHPLWVVDRRQLYSSIHRTIRGKGHPNLHPTAVRPHWRPASDVYELDYLVAPIAIGGDIKVSRSFAILTGVYMAEGNLQPSNKAVNPTGVVLTIAYNEKEFKELILYHVEKLGYAYDVRFNKSAGTCSITIKNAEFASEMKALCGSYSHKKRMRGELRQWDRRSLTYFLAGYINGDGSNNGTRIRCITTSENLAQDLQMAFGRLGIPASGNGLGWAAQFTNKRLTREGYIRKNHTGKPWRKSGTMFTIGASLRKIKEQSRIMDFVVGHKGRSGRKPVVEQETDVRIIGDYMLYPISNIEKGIGTEEVYNLEVEDDHTYLADGIIVHNCNENPKDAIGIIFDTSLTKIQGVQGNIWAVTGVLGIDKTKNQEIARKFADGEINTVSMGALASSFTCSICGAINDEFHGCSHIPANSTGDVNFYPVVDGEGNIEIAFLNAHGLDPIETSVVADPAWAPALSDTILQK